MQWRVLMNSGVKRFESLDAALAAIREEAIPAYGEWFAIHMPEPPGETEPEHAQ